MTDRQHSLRFTSAGRPLVFAHRGGAALAPENTVAAFDRALALGADGIELDVRITQDGIVVVYHDRRLERTTNGRGRVALQRWSDLARVDAGYWFGPDEGYPFRDRGIGISRLRDVLVRYPELLFVIEMKIDHPAFARAVVDEVRAAGALDRACVGAYRLRALGAARRYEPRLITSAGREEIRWALYRSLIRWPLRRVAYDAFQVPECSGRTRIVSPRFVRHAHAAGLVVHVWTVDAPDDMRRLLAWGADGLITDRPDLAVPIAAAHRSFQSGS